MLISSNQIHGTKCNLLLLYGTMLPRRKASHHFMCFDKCHANYSRWVWTAWPHCRWAAPLHTIDMAISNSFILDGVTFTTVALSLLFVSAIYSVNLVIQRLFLSPIARFPGPKLAGMSYHITPTELWIWQTFKALTFWYELYYDVYLQGQYIFKIEELHRTYGKTCQMFCSKAPFVRCY